MSSVTRTLPFAALARRSALSQPTYEPGKPIEDVARELGLDPATIIKLASNENAFGASPAAREAASRALADVQLYPDGGCFRLKAALAAHIGVGADQIILGNGSNEILELVGHAFLDPGDEAVMGNPAFIVYKLVTLLFGGQAVEVPLVEHRHDLDTLRAAVTSRTKLVFLPSPNNPTGTVNSEAEIVDFVRGLPDSVIFIYDEAYAEYVDEAPDLRPLIAEGRKVLCLRTFSKIYGLAGLRVGYGYGHPELIQLLNRVRQPFNVNAVAQAAALAALGDQAFVRRCREANAAGLRQLEGGFTALGLEYIPSRANFITVRVGQGAALFEQLQGRGVIVRPMGSYGMGDWLRVSVGSESQNERLLKELKYGLSQRGA